MDRSDSGSPAPSNGSGRGKGLRVTWAESPNGSRPGSNMGWTEKVADIELQTLRAQTPPLAGEWSSSKENKSVSQSSESNSLSSVKQISLMGGHGTGVTGSALVSNTQANLTNQTSTFQSNQKSFTNNNLSMGANFLSQPNTAVNNHNNVAMKGFSMSAGSQVGQLTTFQSAQTSQKSSFSSSSTFQTSSSFQSGSTRSQTFEAFPGMGKIENLNLENEKAGK